MSALKLKFNSANDLWKWSNTVTLETKKTVCGTIILFHQSDRYILSAHNMA